MNIKITKTDTEKLVYSKFLYEQGISNSKKAYPFSTIAILNYHDAIEFFIAIIMDIHRIKKDYGLSIEKCIEKINKELEPKGIETITYTEIKKINNLRNLLKHEASIPAKIELENATSQTTSFLIKNFEILIGQDFNEISTAQLIGDKEIRGHLTKARKKFEKGEIKDVRTELAYAFWKIINRQKYHYQDTHPLPFHFGEDNLKSSFLMDLPKNYRPTHYQNTNEEFEKIYKQFEEIGKFIDNSKETIDSMRNAIEMLSLGIDYRKFVIFSKSIPKAERFALGTYLVNIGYEMESRKFTDKDLQFCTEFVIESYFLLNN
jgi:hypothetical protein